VTPSLSILSRCCDVFAFAYTREPEPAGQLSELKKTRVARLLQIFTYVFYVQWGMPEARIDDVMYRKWILKSSCSCYTLLFVGTEALVIPL
jgi:hypothetical protein